MGRNGGKMGGGRIKAVVVERGGGEEDEIKTPEL